MRPAPPLDVAGYVRQARRRTRMSQRELAAACGVSASTISRAESGRGTTSVASLSRLLRAAGLRLLVVDADTRRVPPLREAPAVRDLADRRFPAHLDLILDPEPGEWWGDQFGLVRPPETFRRDPAARYAHRLVFHEMRGVLVHGESADWRERVRRDRARFERDELIRQGRYPPGTIPYRRSRRTRRAERDAAPPDAAGWDPTKPDAGGPHRRGRDGSG